METGGRVVRTWLPWKLLLSFSNSFIGIEFTYHSISSWSQVAPEEDVNDDHSGSEG